MASYSSPKQNNRTLITCGIIGAVLLCLGGLGAGALLLIGLAFPGSGTPTPTALAVQAQTTHTPAVISATRAPASPPAVLGEIPYEAVVQILAIVDVDGQEDVGWSGSGSIISPDGYILTNAHVVLSDRYYTVKYLVVAMTVAQDAPPEPRYRMDLLQVDQPLDIAVGRITADKDGNPIDPASLNLPTVPLGASDTLNLGDPLTIIGYPGIGGETITLTRGEVSGFTSDPAYGNRAFIKTSATIAGGNSGGLASNNQGELIGVPTQLGYGGGDQYIDCRVLADTNRDGVIDDRDSCVPTGGFINALRPVKLAIPLIEAAKRGEININAGVQESAGELPTDSTVVYQDDFSDPNSGWDDSSDSDSAVGYVGGAYQISVFQPNYLSWSYQFQDYTDVIVQVDTQIIQNAVNSDYGLICRRQDVDNFYALEISEDGYFTIYKYENGEYISLYDWEYTSLIDPGQANTLTIACIGPSLSIAAGGKVLGSVEDTSFTTGSLGMIAGTFDTPNFTVAFDNFTVYEP
jgi:S1-C subfamily serine protease